jgi:hypothetical protein
MSEPSIPQLVKALSNPDKFRTWKTLRLELCEDGSSVRYQNNNIVGFKMYCSRLNRFMAVSCDTRNRLLDNPFLSKITSWYKHKNCRIELPFFLYLRAELLMVNYAEVDIVISEWKEDVELAFSYNIEKCVKIVDDVAFSVDMKTLIAFSLPRKRIEKYTIPDGVVKIRNNAFSGCNHVLEVVIPKSVTYIGSEAFIFCDNLHTLTIPETIKHIGYSAFYRTRIKSVHIPTKVKIIGQYFQDCYNLKTITIGEAHPFYIIIDGVLFSKDKRRLLRYPPGKIDTSYTVPDGVDLILYGAFSGCMHLKEINLPDSVAFIDDYAFAETSFKTIKLPEKIRYIGESIFYENENFDSFVFPTGAFVKQSPENNTKGLPF